MTFTAALPPGVDLPEATWLPASVRRHGGLLEVTAEGSRTGQEAEDKDQDQSGTRRQALEEWLARSAAQPVCHLDDAALDDLRWQQLKEKHRR